MDIALPEELREQVDQELANGRYRTAQDLVEAALRRFLEDEERSRERLQSLRRIGKAVDEAGLYDKALIPEQE